MKILVVDDEVISLQSFLSEIIEYDVDYKFFKDSLLALEYMKKNPLDAIFVDIGMPNINGLEFADRAIELYPDISIVFITGMNVTMNDLTKTVKKNTLGFLYKPYNANQLLEYIHMIQKKTPELTIKMFDSFDCFIDDKVVLFSSSKSKELFALLITYNGKSLTMSEAITLLWPSSDIEKAKILYRNAVFRLRRTLSEIGVNCVTFKRAMLTLDKTHIRCDYWDYLKTGEGAYHGEFLKSYDWSIDYLGELDAILEKKKNS